MAIPLNISRRVLTIGSQYKNHRGGIGGVIDTYSKHFEQFNYICSYGTTENKVYIVANFIRSICQLVVKLSTDREISIVHIHGAAKGSFFRKYLLFNISKRLFRRKVIFHSHGSEMEKFYQNSPKIVKRIFADFINHADLVICLSGFWKNFFSVDFKPRKIIVLENIVEKPKEDIKEITEKKAGNLDKVLFLFLGAIGDRKGIFDLLEVLHSYQQEFEGRMQLIVGGNGEVRKLEEYLDKYGLRSMVNFKGWVSGAEKQELLKKAHVYVLPSYNEGLPLSILEAMTFGMPVISTKVGGIPEIVNNHENGCLIDPGDKDALYRSLKFFVERKDAIQAFGENSLRKVIPYYADQVIPKLEYIYKDLLEKK